MYKLKHFLRISLLGLFLTLGHPLVTTGQYIDSLEISLITSGPGDDLYTTFGHSALRIHDLHVDKNYVFNYGTFDFSTKHFYWKFMRGRLLYFLSVQQYPIFLREYKTEGRKLTEQFLDLNQKESHDIFDSLIENFQPGNRYYKYDFFFDNCATRIRDIFEDTFGNDWKVGNIIPHKGLTFRESINAYLRQSPWERLGINLMFGVRADKEMSNREMMFLPRFLKEGIAHATIQGKPLVRKTEALNLPSSDHKPPYPIFKQPLFWFSLMAFVLILLSFMKWTPTLQTILSWVDRCLFFLTGLLGCFLLFMWLGTDHEITVWNFNILWLLPTNIIFSFYFFKNETWVRVYALIVLIILVILLAGWFVLPQQLPYVAIPLMIAIGVRALKIAGRVRKFQLRYRS